MRNWKLWLGIGLGGLILLVLAYVAFTLWLLDFFVDLWWFRSLEYEGYFWLRLLYPYLVFGLFTAVFFILFFLNFQIASRYLRNPPPPAEGVREKRTVRWIQLLKSGSMRVYTPLSLILAVPIAWPFYEKWESGLLYLFGPNTGITDTSFGKDVSYYLFSYPVYRLIQNNLFLAFIFLFLALVILYWLESRLLSKEELTLPKGARVHLTGVIVLVFLLKAWDYVLQRHDLLYTVNHEPLFFGPGFMEMRFFLPLIWISLIAFLGASFSFLFFFHKRKGFWFFVGFFLVYLLALGVRNAPIFPQKIQQYIVQPNELKREAPFIKSSITETLRAYDLADVEIREFETRQIPWLAPNFLKDVRQTLRNIPVWDQALLDDVYKQLQGIRPYYDFPRVGVDRYTVSDRYQQVYLAGRELDFTKLPEKGKSWVNRHMQYTHGYGAVMTPAAQVADEPMVWFVQDIPPVSRQRLAINRDRMGIYYGLKKYDYVIAPNELGEIGYPKKEGNQIVNYTGKGGVPVSSVFKKLFFAVYFEDRNIFFTTKTKPESKLLFRRNIMEAISRLTPFLRIDSAPYPVLTPQGFYWIVDAYTTSDLYPNAEEYQETFNYIRNSVKIVVDAYHGSFDFYIADPDDPIIQAYSRCYPGLFKSLETLPSDIRKHIRYPKHFFDIQLSIYQKYHQTDPELFFRQEDVWEFAQKSADRSYYLTLKLFDPTKHDFLILSSMKPMRRDNLRALVVVGCDGENYGRKVVYSFPKSQQVYGPEQIQTLIDQDTDIAQQITLWDQAGSEVRRGRVIILPLEDLLLYIQPVYLLSATQLKIPELKRLILTQGEVVVMERSLEEGITALRQRIKERFERRQQRFSPGPAPRTETEQGSGQ